MTRTSSKQLLVAVMNRLNPAIRSINRRHTIHCRQIVARFHCLSSSVDFQSNHPTVLKRWTSRNGSSTASSIVTPAFQNALTYGNKFSIRDECGEFSYEQMYYGAVRISLEISEICGSGNQSKIAFLVPNTALYVLVQWACWMAGHIAVPLSNKHSAAMQDYFLKDTKASLIITTSQYESLLKPLATSNKCPIIVYNHDYPVKHQESVEVVLLKTVT